MGEYMEEDKLLTTEEVTKMLGFTNPITVLRLARARKLEVVVFGTRRRFRKSVVDKYILDHTLPASKSPEEITDVMLDNIPHTKEAVDKFIKEHTLPAKE